MVLKAIKTWCCACLHFLQKIQYSQYNIKWRIFPPTLFDKPHSHLLKRCLINHIYCHFKTHYSFDSQLPFCPECLVILKCRELTGCVCLCVCVHSHPSALHVVRTRPSPFVLFTLSPTCPYAQLSPFMKKKKIRWAHIHSPSWSIVLIHTPDSTPAFDSPAEFDRWFIPLSCSLAFCQIQQ